MEKIDMLERVSLDILDSFYRKKKAVKLKNKTYRRKMAVNTSVAAALVAALSAGIWIIQDDRGDNNTSTPVLQNPSEDNPVITPPVTETSKTPPIIDESTTPLPPITEVSEAPLPPEIDTSTPEIDWDLIRLEAVYNDKYNLGDAFYSAQPGYLTYNEVLFDGLDEETRIAVYLNTYVKDYDLREAEKIIWQRLWDENKEQLDEWERIIADKEAGWYEVQQEKYFPLLESMHEEARQTAEATVNEDKGREILFAELEKMGIKVFRRDMKLYVEGKDSDLFIPRTFYLTFLTQVDVENLKDFIKENGNNYGIHIEIAPSFLKEDTDVVYKSNDRYFLED